MARKSTKSSEISAETTAGGAGAEAGAGAGAAKPSRSRTASASANGGGAPKTTSIKKTTAKSSKTKASEAKPKTSARAKAGPSADSRASEPESGNGSPSRHHALVIVESAKKAKSIGKFLGSRYLVKACLGHVRDLPSKGLNIDIPNGYKPTYAIMDDKASVVNELRRAADKSDIVYLATDPDREGESIAWHLAHALNLNEEKSRRVLFYEITEKAIREAFRHVGVIDMQKVDAQQTRRLLDRIVGYQLSPWLSNKIFKGLSAGRVQSVAVRLIAEREKEILAFVSEEYWEIDATLSRVGSTNEADQFQAKLAEWNGSKFEVTDGETAAKVRDELANLPYSVAKIQEAEKRDRPEAPFKTSTLQQQAAIRMRFSSEKTMKVAQELYEGIDIGDGSVGLITYMRTDSLRVSDEAIKSVRDLIVNDFGPKYLPDRPNAYEAGKLAQEAHEAIRPTDLTLTPESIQGRLTPDQFRLYQLIYRRFIASQMTPAVFAVTNVEVVAGANQGLFRTQGRILKFDGYRRVLPPAGKQEDRILPNLTQGMELDLLALDPSQHFTQPPPRYTEATLIKALEKESIGRPSTYAPIIKTIQNRNYVEQKDRKFFATNLGMTVTDVLVQHFPKIMDVKFTSHMEGELDRIVSDKADMIKVLDEFYQPFHESLKAAQTQLERVHVASSEKCPECGSPMVEKSNKNGRFLGCSRWPDCKATMSIDGQVREAPIPTEHKCLDCGSFLLLRNGKRGPFLACSSYPACKAKFQLDENGQPVPTSVKTEHVCEKCGKPMLKRKGPRGDFLGCSGYPKCKSTVQLDSEGKPAPKVEIGVKCSKCQGPMAVRNSRRGPFLGCMAYPKCRNAMPIPDDLKETLKAQNPELFTAPAPSPAADALKSLQFNERCEKCDRPMVARAGRAGKYFLGCSGYPKCRSIQTPSEDALAKIQAAMEQQPVAS